MSPRTPESILSRHALHRAAIEALEARRLLAHFAVIGDFSSDLSTAPTRDVANLVKSWTPDFVATVGDNNYPDGAASTIDDNVGQWYHQFIGNYTGSYGGGATPNQFWPTMTYLARHIWRGELPMWNFGIGLGQNMYPDWLVDPFAAAGILTGEWVLPYTIGPMHVAKAVVAALFAARYFQLRGYSRIACVAGALSLAFCGHIMSRGTWYEYATEVAVVSFYLFAMERFAQTGRFGLLALGTFLIGCPGSFYAYHYFFLLTGFALVRIFVFGDRLFAKPRAVLAQWAAASAAGVLLVAVFLLPDLLTTLRSTRSLGI